MKKKIPLLLILSGLSGSAWVSASETIAANKEEQQSIHGGVFDTTSDVLAGTNGNNQVLLKDSSGKVRVIGEGAVGSSNSALEKLTILVDRTPPVITFQWLNAMEQADEVIIGPKSEVNIAVNEAQLKQITIDDQILNVPGMTQRIKFNLAAKSLQVLAEDEFGNVSQSKLVLKPDFESPSITWDLTAPAIKKGGQWFAGKQADLVLSATDNVAMGTVHLNQQAVDWIDHPLSVNEGDELQVTDALGNVTTEKLAWQVDSMAPTVVVTVENEKQAATKRFSVRVNELIDLTTMDLGVGVKLQKYKGKSRKWLPLPKKFRFTSKGNYRIKVISEDQVGNTLETTLKFKVKR
ncbi:hypothetical protein [Marinicella litoralis]|nr:hypothetical protein [Marinicella litoralis]